MFWKEELKQSSSFMNFGRMKKSAGGGRKSRYMRKKANEENAVCAFCMQSNESELECGELKKTKSCSVVAHYFCMLFATGLNQREEFDEEHDPLAGFATHAIERTRRKAARLKCIYCHRGYATVSCAHSGCKAQFHLPCGRENGSFHEFFGSFRSLCKEHAPPTNATVRFGRPYDKKHSRGKERLPDTCSVCMQSFGDVAVPDDLHEVVSSGCCKNAVFHFSCVQNYASSAGLHYLRCPFCKEKDQYQESLRQSGIYIPDRDAAWEKGDAFSDLYRRPAECAAPVCACPHGRAHVSAGDQEDEDEDEDEAWKLTYCDVCGSKACHNSCLSSGGVGDDGESITTTSIDDDTENITSQHLLDCSTAATVAVFVCSECKGEPATATIDDRRPQSAAEPARPDETDHQDTMEAAAAGDGGSSSVGNQEEGVDEENEPVIDSCAPGKPVQPFLDARRKKCHYRCDEALAHLMYA